MGSQAPQLHVFFFPLMAPGHVIPTIDVARLFAARGTKSTIITTPLNALHLLESIDRDKRSGLDIGVQIIPFPTAEAGLPEGCESLNSITSEQMTGTFFKAVGMLQQPFERLLEEHHPDCIISDIFLPWTSDLANKHGIPRLVFHGTSNFSMCVSENIERYAPQQNVASDAEIFVVPGLPHKIEITRSQLHNRGTESDTNNPFSAMKDKMEETEVKSFGVLMNSFYELEPGYAEYYTKEMGRRTWNIGPVSLYNRNIIDKSHRGKESSFNEHHCLNWLESKEPDSVIYISFGSGSSFSSAQLQEIAEGLEASQIPFIWVVRMPRKKEIKDQFLILPQGFEERMEGKGLIFKDWAPQVLILDHPAVGGFMTHCGWNSTLEGISAGVPLITWPVFAEQFNNEKLVTQVLRTGISAGNRVWSSWVEPEAVSVTKEKVKEVVTELMGDGQEAQDRRMRARELAETAKRAVKEGGSSYADLTSLIEELKVHSQQSKSTKQSNT